MTPVCGECHREHGHATECRWASEASREDVADDARKSIDALLRVRTAVAAVADAMWAETREGSPSCCEATVEQWVERLTEALG